MVKIYVRESRIIGIAPDSNPYFSIIFRINLQNLIKNKIFFLGTKILYLEIMKCLSIQGVFVLASN